MQEVRDLACLYMGCKKTFERIKHLESNKIDSYAKQFAVEVWIRGSPHDAVSHF